MFSSVFLILQPSWISVDFDNWRDWEHEEDEGKAEYDQYMDVSAPPHSTQVIKDTIQNNAFLQYFIHILSHYN